jgi:hypothetical protein
MLCFQFWTTGHDVRQNAGFSYAACLLSSKERSQPLDKLWFKPEDKTVVKSHFSTHEMKHFQIADLFGKRFAPDLEIELKESFLIPSPLRMLYPVIINRGRAVAKYAMCACRVKHPSVRVILGDSAWVHAVNENCYYVEMGSDKVIYPDSSRITGAFPIDRSSLTLEDTPVLKFEVYAEDMPMKSFSFGITNSGIERL